MAKKILTSALGIAEPYAYIAKPDYGNEERGFGNPRGIYKVDLTIPNKDPRCQRMVDEIVKCHEEAYAAAVEEYEANPPVVARGKKKPIEPYEGDLPFIDNGDGTTTFKFKCYASFQDKKTKETKHINLVVVDSKGKKMEDVPIIGGGSKLKVKYSLVPYKWNNAVGASVKLQLESVMLVELATFGGGEDDWADEVEENGYVASGSAKARKPRDEESWDEDDSESYEEEEEDSDGDF